MTSSSHVDGSWSGRLNVRSEVMLRASIVVAIPRSSGFASLTEERYVDRIIEMN